MILCERVAPSSCLEAAELSQRLPGWRAVSILAMMVGLSVIMWEGVDLMIWFEVGTGTREREVVEEAMNDDVVVLGRRQGDRKADGVGFRETHGHGGDGICEGERWRVEWKGLAVTERDPGVTMEAIAEVNSKDRFWCSSTGLVEERSNVSMGEPTRWCADNVGVKEREAMRQVIGGYERRRRVTSYSEGSRCC